MKYNPKTDIHKLIGCTLISINDTHVVVRKGDEEYTLEITDEEAKLIDDDDFFDYEEPPYFTPKVCPNCGRELAVEDYGVDYDYGFECPICFVLCSNCGFDERNLIFF